MPGELRLFLEEICCDLCRFRHVDDEGLRPAEVQVRREVYLDHPGAFADIHVRLPDGRAYYFEVKADYPADRLLHQLARKYGHDAPTRLDGDRLVVLVQRRNCPDWPALERALRATLRPGLALELWDEPDLVAHLERAFGVRAASLDPRDLIEVRRAIDRAKWRAAFDDDTRDALMSALLWHFSPWDLAALHREHHLGPESILAPGLYRDLVVVMADLSAFSSYVRDTRDDGLIRQALATFYSETRHAIHNCGGMLYQFVGDEVVGVFGFPFGVGERTERALSCARALRDIGASVSYHWQREIDRVQRASGVHIGVALGDLNLIPLRPFAFSHIGFIGEALNIAARLMSAAQSHEIIASNTFYNRLGSAERGLFRAAEAVDAKNIGQIACWRLPPG